MRTVTFVILTSLTFLSSAQRVDEIIKKYNYKIDPNNILDSITHLKVDNFRRLFHTEQNIFLIDTTTNFYSVFGENSFKNRSNAKKVDMNYMGNVSSWEAKNIIKTHVNYLIADADETFGLVDITDSTYIIKKFSSEREVFYEIDRENYDLRQKTIKYRGKTMISKYSDFEYVDGIKVATKVNFENEIVTAELLKFNFQFSKEGKAD